MVEGGVKPLEPAYILSDFSLLPVSMLDDPPLGDAVGISLASDVNISDWPDKRKKLIQGLEAAIARRDSHWIKASSPSVEECLTVASYLDLPRPLVQQVVRKVRTTGLRPWPFYHWWAVAQKP